MHAIILVVSISIKRMLMEWIQKTKNEGSSSSTEEFCQVNVLCLNNGQHYMKLFCLDGVRTEKARLIKSSSSYSS